MTIALKRQLNDDEKAQIEDAQANMFRRQVTQIHTKILPSTCTGTHAEK